MDVAAAADRQPHCRLHRLLHPLLIMAHHRMVGLPRILRDLYHHSGSCDLLLPRQNMIKRRKIGILSGRLNGRRHTILADVL